MVLKFKRILKMKQERLLNFCFAELMKRGYKRKNIKIGDYIYAKGEIPILLVAHLDTVHKSPPEVIVDDRTQNILWSPQGIGGDDRCGVYAVLKICEQFKPYVLFTTDEEIGCVGARKFTEDIKELPVNFIIEIDRRGNNQVVFYSCGNKEFQSYILGFGFNKEIGSYSDVKYIAEHYDIAGCNLSAGYYNEHTTTEHIYIDHLFNTIVKVKKILKDTKNHKKYDCQKEEPYYWGDHYNYSDYYDDYYGYGYGYKYYRNDKNYTKPIEVEEKEEGTKEPKEFDDETLEFYMQMEEDYYDLTAEQWKEKYGEEKPKNLIDIYE